MWKYFLLSSAGSFGERHNQLWEIVRETVTVLMMGALENISINDIETE